MGVGIWNMEDKTNPERPLHISDIENGSLLIKKDSDVIYRVVSHCCYHIVAISCVDISIQNLKQWKLLKMVKENEKI